MMAMVTTNMVEVNKIITMASTTIEAINRTTHPKGPKAEDRRPIGDVVVIQRAVGVLVQGKACHWVQGQAEVVVAWDNLGQTHTLPAQIHQQIEDTPMNPHKVLGIIPLAAVVDKMAVIHITPSAKGQGRDPTGR